MEKSIQEIASQLLKQYHVFCIPCQEFNRIVEENSITSMDLLKELLKQG